MRQEPDWEVGGRLGIKVEEMLRVFMHQAWSRPSFDFRLLDDIHQL